MDGNFSLAPSIFTQLYVVRVPLGESYITSVYALLAGKSHEDYKKMLDSIVDTCHQLGYHPDPSFAMTCFEQSVIGATQDVLGTHVQHIGCHYHLTEHMEEGKKA
jgi:hypothetical protein